MTSGLKSGKVVLPLAVGGVMIAVWWGLSAAGLFPASSFPGPVAVVAAFGEEVKSGRMARDVVASLFRVGAGFGLAAVLGIPLGLWLGHSVRGRTALMPFVNFFRNLSPLAWIPFAVLWLGIGDPPAIFLIFLSSFFPLILAASAAVANVPAVYFSVARDHGLDGYELMTKVTLPAAMPQIITALRVTAGLAWVVVVAAEMIAGRDGLGFAILDARNGLRTDVVVVGMVAIGFIGIGIDRLLAGMARIPSVRWGYEQ